jgi:hypothetical protein
MAKLRLLLCALLLTAAAAYAQRAMTVAELTTFIKSQIKEKGDDRTTADYLLHKIKLTQKLDDRTVEELQGQGAGPRTIQALRKLSEESAGLPAAPAPHVAAAPPPSFPAPDSVEQAEVLGAMRDYALNYTKRLPNYICTQVTRRQIDPTGQGRLRPEGDVVQEQLTFFDQKETYKVTMINGQSVSNIAHERLGGTVSSGEFGTMLHEIFDPDTGADFRWDHWGTLRDHRMYVFAFHVSQSKGYHIYHGETKREVVAAYRGLVYADAKTKAIMRITMECINMPADYPIKEVALTLDYKPTDISGQEYTLPYHFQLHSRETRYEAKNEADYKLYRKFGAETTITFAADEPIPEDQLKEQPAKPEEKNQAPAKKR